MSEFNILRDRLNINKFLVILVFNGSTDKIVFFASLTPVFVKFDIYFIKNFTDFFFCIIGYFKHCKTVFRCWHILICFKQIEGCIRLSVILECCKIFYILLSKHKQEVIESIFLIFDEKV